MKKKIKDMTIEEKREYQRMKTKEWRLKNPKRNKISRHKYKKSDKGKSANGKYHRKRYIEHRDEILDYMRDYYSKNPKKTHQTKEYIRRYMKEYYSDPEKKEKMRIRRQAYFKHRKDLLELNPDCILCGSNEFLEIHHEEYDNSDLTKLKVLCRKCHRFLHRINNQEVNKNGQ